MAGDDKSRRGAQALRVAAKAGRGATRETNLRLTLQLLLRSDGISRADLVRATGLTPATISDLVAELASVGLVEELGRGPAKVGKPAVMLGVPADARSVIAVDLSGESAMVGAVYNLSGSIVERVTAPLKRQPLKELVGLVSELEELAPAPLLGIGVGTPGVVDRSGVVIEADNVGWFNFDLARELTDRFQLPAVISNDMDAAVLAEFAGSQPDQGNLALIGIGAGVGAGLILNGHSHLGDSNSAGEIGHVRAVENGALCSCGQHGCLETVLAVPRVRALIADGAKPREVLGTAARSLGQTLAPVIAALDIHDVVIAGPEDLFDESFRDATQEVAAERLLPRVGGSLKVRGSNLGPDLVLAGASAAVISRELGVT